MSFHIESSKLKQLFQTTQAYLYKQTNSILNYYLVEIINNAIMITSKNNISQMSVSETINTKQNTKFLLKPNFLQKIKNLNGMLNIEIKNNTLIIENSTYKASIRIFDSINYPKETINNIKHISKLNYKILKQLSLVYKTTEKKDVIREITGCLIKSNNNNISFIATQTQINISKSNDFLVFTTENISLITKTIKGEFLDYSDIIIENNNHQKIKINAQNLLESIIKVIFNTKDENQLVNFKTQNNEIYMTSKLNENEYSMDRISLENNIENFEYNFYMKTV